MLRITREDLSIPGNVLIPNMLDDILMNYTMIQKIGDNIGVSEKRRNWEKCEGRTVAINTFTLLFIEGKEK